MKAGAMGKPQMVAANTRGWGPNAWSQQNPQQSSFAALGQAMQGIGGGARAPSGWSSTGASVPGRMVQQATNPAHEALAQALARRGGGAAAPVNMARTPWSVNRFG